jgi:hypothetical protein
MPLLLSISAFVSRLGHNALAFLASDPPASGLLGELYDKFLEHFDAVFRVAVYRIFRVVWAFTPIHGLTTIFERTSDKRVAFRGSVVDWSSLKKVVACE